MIGLSDPKVHSTLKYTVNQAFDWTPVLVLVFKIKRGKFVLNNIGTNYHS